MCSHVLFFLLSKFKIIMAHTNYNYTEPNPKPSFIADLCCAGLCFDGWCTSNQYGFVLLPATYK